MRPTLLLPLTLLTVAAFAGESDKKNIAPPEEDRWKFALSMPGWAAGVSGDVGVFGIVAHVDVNTSDLLRHADMLAAFRGEASKGRFGITTDFLYMSMSDGIGTDTIVKKLDIQFDQTLADLGLRWRLVEGPRGWVDVTAGVRYTNMYQKYVTQPNAERLDEVSTDLVDAVSAAVRTAIKASGIGEIIAQHVVDGAGAATPDPKTGGHVPIAHLRVRDRDRHRVLIHNIIEARRAELTAAVQAAAQAAQQGATAALAAAQQRVNKIKKELSKKIADALEDSLDARVSRTDDWFDPYVGLRARYNFNERFYFTVKGDVGGFSVGSQFTWQVEGALGCHLTQNIFAELGYRALGVDYQQDNLTYDMITHGAQATVGIEF